MNAPVQTTEARELALAGMGASRLRKEDARFIQAMSNRHYPNAQQRSE